MSPEDAETPEPAIEHDATTPTRRRSSVLGGALLGAVALTASVLGVGAIASAQDEPEVDDTAEVESLATDDDADAAIAIDDFDDPAWAAFDECITSALGEIGLDDTSDDGTDIDLTDEEWEALEAQFEAAEQACEDVLPDEVKAEIAAWQPYEECLDTQLGDMEESLFGDADDAELTDEQWQALDDAWTAADQACFDLLPETAKADAEAFMAYDQCLSDAGLGDEMGAVVFVDDGETGQSIQFGQSVGTVTITGDSSGVTVATDGDVSIIDDSALEAAFEACDQLLPEDLFEGDDLLDDGRDDQDADEDGDDD